MSQVQYFFLSLSLITVELGSFNKILQLTNVPSLLKFKVYEDLQLGERELGSLAELSDPFQTLVNYLSQ